MSFPLLVDLIFVYYLVDSLTLNWLEQPMGKWYQTDRFFSPEFHWLWRCYNFLQQQNDLCSTLWAASAPSGDHQVTLIQYLSWNMYATPNLHVMHSIENVSGIFLDDSSNRKMERNRQAAFYYLLNLLKHCSVLYLGKMQSFPTRKRTIPIYPLPAMAIGNANLFAQRARLFKKGCTEPNEAHVFNSIKRPSKTRVPWSNHTTISW